MVEQAHDGLTVVSDGEGELAQTSASVRRASMSFRTSRSGRAVSTGILTAPFATHRW